MGATVVVEGPGEWVPGGCEEAGFTVRYPAGTPFRIIPRPGLRSFVEIRLSDGSKHEGVCLYRAHDGDERVARWFVGVVGSIIPCWVRDDQILRVLDGPLPDRDPSDLVDFTRPAKADVPRGEPDDSDLAALR